MVEGWSATAEGNLGAVLSRGRSVKTMVLEQDAPQVVDVLLASVNSFLPLTSSVDKSAQTLVKGRVGHCATLNAFGDVVVTGGAQKEVEPGCLGSTPEGSGTGTMWYYGHICEVPVVVSFSL